MNKDKFKGIIIGGVIVGTISVALNPEIIKTIKKKVKVSVWGQKNFRISVK